MAPYVSKRAGVFASGHWASVEARRGLTIGLHPASAETTAGGGTRSGMSIGLERSGIEDAMRKLEAGGVRFHGAADEGKAGKSAHFEDPAGHSLYLGELNWGHVEQGEGRYQRA
ncbi:MAG TPA: hypothetical protein VGS58_16345 [Candidatus Sulfopaludibacter sp.]|nr:hypothetical protein [Candidatus Sulfopaludibacter sp.]